MSFTSTTKVLTNEGWVPIIDITEGHSVKTWSGYCPIPQLCRDDSVQGICNLHGVNCSFEQRFFRTKFDEQFVWEKPDTLIINGDQFQQCIRRARNILSLEKRQRLPVNKDSYVGQPGFFIDCSSYFVLTKFGPIVAKGGE